MHFVILLGGTLTPTERLRQQIAGARVLAADSGMKHASILGLVPELWLGDFDSTHRALDEAFADVPRQQFPAAKDMSDGALAIAEAFNRGAKRLTLVGGFGGRFDHALAHGLQLIALAQAGLDCAMTSGDEEAYPLITDVHLAGLPQGTRLSILGLTPLQGLSIKGVRWPLQGVALPMGSTWTLSNETSGDVHASLQQGQALVVVHPLEQIT